MADDWNVRICAFDDLEQCKRAVDSVPDGVTVHVCDGRYALFDGETDLTPGLEAFCGAHPDAVYHAPDSSRLPFGHELLADGVAPECRPGVYAKARWVDEVIPQDTWTLKLDTDERLDGFDVDLSTLDRKYRYCPVIRMHGADRERIHVARLWVPEHWTRWIDDCLVPRELFPRDHPIEILASIWEREEWIVIRLLRREPIEDITVDNYGGQRDGDYLRRRLDHIERIGREDRWTELKAEVEQ